MGQKKKHTGKVDENFEMCQLILLSLYQIYELVDRK